MKRKANYNLKEKIGTADNIQPNKMWGDSLSRYPCVDTSPLSQVYCAVEVMMVTSDHLEGFIVCL